MQSGFINGLREMLGVDSPGDVRAAVMHFIGGVSQELITPINENWKTAVQGELTTLAALTETEGEPALLCAMAKVTLIKLGVAGPLAATAAATAVAAAVAAAAVGSAAEALAAVAATVAAEAAGGPAAAAAKAASLKVMAKVRLMKLGVPAHAAVSAAATAVAAAAAAAEAAEAAMTVAAAAAGSAAEASAWAAAKVAAEAAAAKAANAAGLAEAADGDDWFVEPGELSQLGKLLSPFIMAAEAGADAAKVERWKTSGALYVCVFLNATGQKATGVNVNLDEITGFLNKF